MDEMKFKSVVIGPFNGLISPSVVDVPPAPLVDCLATESRGGDVRAD
jgi:hypothetical protein